MQTTLVVPCYNEERRLDGAAWLGLLSDPALELVFVDDGSRDGTRGVLDRLARDGGPRVSVHALAQNSGKAEAVRAGMRCALDRGAAVLGFADADLATPPEELVRLVGLMRSDDIDILVAARIGLLGRTIERSTVRHYLGRIFATAASLTLRRRIYDTQCGAKLVRASAALEAALAEPFQSRWAFDVELLGRLLIGDDGVPAVASERVREEPLLVWRDVKGSKLTSRQMASALLDLGRIEMQLSARRRRSRAGAIERR